MDEKYLAYSDGFLYDGVDHPRLDPDLLAAVGLHEVGELLEDVVTAVAAEQMAEPTDDRACRLAALRPLIEVRDKRQRKEREERER